MPGREEDFLESDEWADCVHDLRKEQRSHLVAAAAAAAVSSERDGPCVDSMCPIWEGS